MSRAGTSPRQSTLRSTFRGHRALLLALALVAAACSDTTDAGTAAPPDSTGRPPETTDTTPEADTGPTPSEGCGTTTAVAGDSEQRFASGGQRRRYLQTLPATHDGETPVPIVIDLHGYSEGAEIHRAMSGLAPYGVEQGFATITPHGSGTFPRWDFAPEQNTDVDVIVDLLDHLERELCLDTARVYVTGLSNGAMMTTYLACDAADRFAAAAPVAGIQDPPSCDPARPVPVIAFHGTADPFVPFEGGIGDAALDLPTDDGGTIRDLLDEADPAIGSLGGEPIPDRVQSWADRNGCVGEPTETSVGDEVRRWSLDCPDGAEVELFIVDEGGHTWPGSELSANLGEIMGPTTFDIDANELMWDFFQQHRLPVG